MGSEILQIAASIRALKAAGRSICNLTVGDFDPRQFPIPEGLKRGVVEALEQGHTNYPPAEGLPELREAVCRFYGSDLGLDIGPERVLIAGGARPLLYVAYRTVLDPGERILYPTPSWNNNHYAHLALARGVPVPCGPESRFLPTAESLRHELPRARLLTLNSPLNPTGTAIEPATLHAIARAVLAENAARRGRGARELFLLYDQVYWKLCVEGARHVTPMGLEPEMEGCTILVDAISKSFAATGLRVGWAVGPPDVIERMTAVLGHVGGWAPRAEQVATARWLADSAASERYLAHFRSAVAQRLSLLHEGFQAMQRAGLPVESLPPMGAIYLSVRFPLAGFRAAGARGAGSGLQSSEDVRRYLLEEAGVGIVPFRAFGVDEDRGWFRLSVGAVSLEEIEKALPRIERALAALRAPAPSG